MKNKPLNKSLITVFISIFLILILPLSATAAVGVAECGIITEDVILSQDVSSPGTCFTIGASDLTLDCAGHTIVYGTGRGANSFAVWATRKDNIIIKNCIIRDSAQSQVQNQPAIRGDAVTNSKIEDNMITTSSPFSSGIILASLSNNNQVSSNTIITTGTPGAQGIILGGNFNIISNNEISTSSWGGHGINLGSGSDGNIIFDNVISVTSEGANEIMDNSGEVNYFTHPPLFDLIGDQPVEEGVQLTFTVVEGNELTFTVLATDADEDSLTYSLPNGPDGATFVNQVFRWAPTVEQVGSHNLTFRVSDGELGDEETVIVTVNSREDDEENEEDEENGEDEDEDGEDGENEENGENEEDEEDRENGEDGEEGEEESSIGISLKEREYHELEDEFEELKDDYDNHRRGYQDALEWNAQAENAQADIDKYKNQLENLEDSLAELEDEVAELIDDLEDEDNPDPGLLDDAEDLESEINDLQNLISNLADNLARQVSSPTAMAAVAELSGSISHLSSTLSVPSLVSEEKVPEMGRKIDRKGGGTFQIILLSAGIVAVLVVIIFLMAVLL